MKTSSSDLFQLIKSMTRSEKGYFKKTAGLTKGDKVYLKLFDAIEAQAEYNEDKIKEKFKGEQFIRQISVAKNNLYSHILRSLNQSSISSNIRYELKHNTVNAEILFNKGLTAQALKMVTRLKSSAMEIEEFDTALMLLNLERLIQLKSFADDKKRTDELYNEELDVISKRKNLVHYNKLFGWAYYISTKYGYLRNRKDEKRFEEILNDKYMKDPSQANSYLAKIYYNEIFFYYYVLKYDFKEALKWNIKALDLVKKNEMFFKTHMEKYFSLYQNRILQYFYLRRFKDVELHSELLVKMLNDKKLNVPDRIKSASMGKILCIRFYSYINSGNFDTASGAVEQTKALINDHPGLVDNSIKIILYNAASYYYFIIENYAEALEWINKLLHDPGMKYFVEMFCNARWYELLIHYELGNYNYIDNVLKTNQRYISSKERLYGIEQVMIKFFGAAVSSKNMSKQDLYRQLLNDLDAETARKTEADLGVDYYNITAIARSRIGNKPLKVLLKEDIKLSSKKAK